MDFIISDINWANELMNSGSGDKEGAPEQRMVMVVVCTVETVGRAPEMLSKKSTRRIGEHSTDLTVTARSNFLTEGCSSLTG